MKVNTENFFRVKVTQKLSHACFNFDSYTSIHFESFKKTSQFDPEKLSQIDSASTITQLLSQVDSEKISIVSGDSVFESIYQPIAQ